MKQDEGSALVTVSLVIRRLLFHLLLILRLILITLLLLLMLLLLFLHLLLLPRLLLLLLLLLVLLLRILPLSGPTPTPSPQAEVGHPVTLGCDYHLEGDSLYSLKWYRDDREFFRYIPQGGLYGLMYSLFTPLLLLLLHNSYF